MAWPSDVHASPARRSRAVARSRSSGTPSRMRVRAAMAPVCRAARMSSTDALRPFSIAGRTMAGLNTPKVATTTSPETSPMHAERLLKYEGMYDSPSAL